MNIYKIKRLVLANDPDNHYFFSRDTLRFFGQTLRSFRVTKIGENYRITAPMKNIDGHYFGDTVRIFNTATNKLERV